MRKRTKIPLTVLLVFILAIAVTLVVITKTAFLERRVNALLKTALEHKYGLKIKLGDIGGSIFSGFSVSDIEVDYGEGDSQYRIASIEYLEIRYSLSDLLHRRWRIKSLYLDSVQVTVRTRPDGALDAPDFAGGGEAGQGVFDFSVDSLVATNSSFSLQRGPERLKVDSLNLFCSLSRIGDVSQLELISCYFSLPNFEISRTRVSGTITVTDSVTMAEDFSLVTDSSMVDFDMSLAKGDPAAYSVTLDSASLNLRELSRVAGIQLDGEVGLTGDIESAGDSIDANVVLSGTLIGWELEDLAARLTYYDKKVSFASLRGKAFGGRINGSGILDLGVSPGTYRYSGAIRDFNLNTLAKGSFDTRLSGDITLDGSGLSNSDFRVNIDAGLGWGRFDEYTFDSASGRIHINSDSVVFVYPFSLLYRSTTVEAGGFIEYDGEMVIQGEAYLPVIDEFKDQIFLRDIGGRGASEFTLRGPTTDPSVTGSFNSDSVVVYDLTSGDLLALIDIQHFFTDPVGDVQVFSGDFDYSGLPGDLLQSHLRIEPGRVWIEQANAAVPPFDLTAAGWLDVQDDTILLTLDKFTAEIDSEVITIHSGVLMTFTDSAISVLSAELSRGSDRVSASGSYRYDESVEFRLQYDSISVGSWLPYFYGGDAERIDGTLSGTGEFSGSLTDPVFLLDLSIANITYDGEFVGGLDGRIAYRDSVLNFVDAVLQGDGNTSTLRGYYPVDLAFETRETRSLSDNPLGLSITVSGTNLDLLEALFEDLERFEGAFTIDVSVSGTPGEPDMDGALSVSNGICKIYYMENPIENISLTGDFDGRELTIRKMDAAVSRRNKRGSINASGSIDLGDIAMPEYHLTLRGSNLPVKYDLGDIEFLIENVDLTVTGDDPPVVTGDVDIAQFLYQEPFYEDIEIDALEAADTTETLDYNIHIAIPRNMWIKNEDADVELKGDLIVLKEGRLENFLGELEIVRGNFYLTSLNRTFEFEPGGRIRFDNIEKFNPLLEDVRMTTTIRDSSGTREICLQISDSLENPRIDVCPESEYTIDEVWVLMNPIGGGFSEPEPNDTLQGATGSSIGDRLTVGATGIALSQASRYISRQLGVERFELTSPTYGHTFNPLETELAIGFYTTPRLYIYGASQLTFDKAQELGFDYRLSKRVFISGLRDRNNLYEFDINLNWEFK